MNHRSVVRLLAPALLGATVSAQGPDFLVTYSQPEQTLSGSAGTVLQKIFPNEIAHIEWSNGPCSSLSAEKWAPRTCFHTMAGDENGDGTYWNPSIFGTIDAVMCGIPTTPVAGQVSPRTIFWSPSAAMGTGVSGAPGLRPGDVGRIARTSAGDGRVEHFMSQEQFNQALGLPLTTPIDIDAIAWAPGMGVYFSLDVDTFAIACLPQLIRDGDILCIRDQALTYTSDWRVATVLANSVEVLYTEAQVDAMVVNAGISDRFGVCIPNAVDTESLEIDWNVQPTTIVGCTGNVVKPDLLFATETMTGASVLTTAGGGSIYVGTCVPTATPCGFGPTMGWQMGVQSPFSSIGVPSYVNGLAAARPCRYSMEPQQHVVTVPAAGLPLGSQNVDISSPFAWNFILWTPAPSGFNVVASSFTNPFGLLCFPDFYPMPNFWTGVPTVGGFASWPMLPIPAGFNGNVIFQSLAFPPSGTLELSTPITVEFL